jgi:hypothetical protein
MRASDQAARVCAAFATGSAMPREPRPDSLSQRSRLSASMSSDDSFLQPEPGTSAGDHLLSGLVPLAALVLSGAVYRRLRAG